MEVIIDANKRYTYADYLTWLDDQRREIIDGFVHLMTPAPSSYHQEYGGNLHTEFRNYLIGKSCKVYSAPFDVRLPKNGDLADGQIDTVVQPDLCIVCNLSKIDDKGCLGAPDLIVEITSPSTTKRDLEYKYQLYQATGVQEYWLLYPNDKTVHVFTLHNGQYQLKGMYHSGNQVPVNIFPGFSIDLHRVFEL